MDQMCCLLRVVGRTNRGVEALDMVGGCDFGNLRSRQTTANGSMATNKELAMNE